jgi:LCP family protein required for cell wall assembly
MAILAADIALTWYDDNHTGIVANLYGDRQGSIGLSWQKMVVYQARILETLETSPCFAMQPGYLLRNRYRIEKALAAGGFGETYLAIDLDYPGQRQVVVKHLKPARQDPETLKVAARLFEAEAKALAEMGEISDRLPMLYAYFEEQGQFYLVQEFIAGETLTNELGTKPLSEAQTLVVLQEILAGLKVVHDRNKIHRDLKPDNIIRRASDRKLVLIDFGAVKEVRQTSTGNPNPSLSASIGIGTKGYMPTEQAIGFPRLTSDIYAVGAIGIQCLTGRHPAGLFDDDILALRWRHLCTVSSKLARLLDKMVAQRHTDRYGDALEVERAINKLIASQNPLIVIFRLFSHSISSLKAKLIFPKSLSVPINLGRREMLMSLIGIGTLSALGGSFVASLMHSWDRENRSSKLQIPEVTKPVNILLLGIVTNLSDVRDGNITDRKNAGYNQEVDSLQGSSGTIMLIRFDPISKGVIILGFPKDTKIEFNGKPVKINLIDKKSGIGSAASAVSNTLGGVEIDRYIRLNNFGLKSLTDVLGGLIIVVPKDMKYQNDSKHLNVNFKAGKQLLDGKKLMSYLRFQENVNDDLRGIQRQHDVIKAMIKQWSNSTNIARIPELISTVKKQIDTNLNVEEIIALGGFADKAKSNNYAIETMILPGSYDHKGYWIPSETEIGKMAARYFDHGA